jgi:hypothetical protein
VHLPMNNIICQTCVFNLFWGLGTQNASKNFQNPN